MAAHTIIHTPWQFSYNMVNGLVRIDKFTSACPTRYSILQENDRGAFLQEDTLEVPVVQKLDFLSDKKIEKSFQNILCWFEA